jgi:hypothetical protein
VRVNKKATVAQLIENIAKDHIFAATVADKPIVISYKGTDLPQTETIDKAGLVDHADIKIRFGDD